MRIAVQGLLAAAITVVATVQYHADAALYDEGPVAVAPVDPLKLTIFDPYPSAAAALLESPAAMPVIAPLAFVPAAPRFVPAPEKAPFFIPPQDMPLAVPPESEPTPAAPQAYAVPAEPLPETKPLEMAPEEAPAEAVAHADPSEGTPALALREAPLTDPAEVSGEPSKASPRAEVQRIQVDGPTLAPLAHAHFCKNYARDCRVQKIMFRGGAIDLTAERHQELVQINAEINRAIKPTRVNESVAAEKWLIAPKTGDCNDYAVTKRHQLLARGWPARALLLAEVVTSWGEHHLVLVIRTRQGDLVADNLSADVRNWTQADYRWVRMQSSKNPTFWSTVKPLQAGAMAMAQTDRRL
jgi:predicted transglutaminase-like cysteine proteinase